MTEEERVLFLPSESFSITLFFNVFRISSISTTETFLFIAKINVNMRHPEVCQCKLWSVDSSSLRSSEQERKNKTKTKTEAETLVFTRFSPLTTNYVHFIFQMTVFQFVLLNLSFR